MDKIKANLIMILPSPMECKDKKTRDVIYCRYCDMIEDIQNLSLMLPSSFKNIDEYKFNFKFKKHNKPSFEGRRIGNINISMYIDLKNTTIHCTTITDGKKIPDVLTDPSIIKQLIMEDFEQNIQNLIFAFNLSYGGLFNISEGVCCFGKSALYINNKKYKDTNIGTGFLQTLYYDIVKKGWPNIQNIHITKTWSWLKNKTNFLNGSSKSRIDRALNALSYTYGHPNYEIIFYLLLGIEALYNKGHGEIKAQIEEKSKMVLGNFSTINSLIKNMYNTRSNFIHGRFDFSKKKIEDDELQESPAHKKYYDSVDTALSILICTLQILINNDCTSILDIKSFAKNDETK